jgi:lipopolysaccharide/colanic/teichoic acid biosynthesis glycosyltransferase
MPRRDKPLLPSQRVRLARTPVWPVDARRLLTSRTGAHAPNRATVKRVLDVSIAVCLLAVLAIPLGVIALAVKLDSQGPVFYRVRRVGFGGRPLTMLKFRKMHDHAHGIPLTADEDPRLTRLGALLARTRLDELPQLWDVLRGRMSLVGPRPEDPEFVALHSDAYDRILSVRPGITGLSQLAFAEEHSILDQSDLVGDYVTRILPQKVNLDTLYARDYGLRMDVKVLTWTIAAVILRRRVSVHRQTGTLTLRRRSRTAASAAMHPIGAAPPVATVASLPSLVAHEPVAAAAAETQPTAGFGVAAESARAA